MRPAAPMRRCVAGRVARGVAGGGMSPAMPRRGGVGVVMVMMDLGLGDRDGEDQRRAEDDGGDRAARDFDHAVFPFPPAPGRPPPYPRNCFNTMGTRPGKSSLIRPGPNASAQAA